MVSLLLGVHARMGTNIYSSRVLASIKALNKPLRVISMCNLFDFCIVTAASAATAAAAA